MYYIRRIFAIFLLFLVINLPLKATALQLGAEDYAQQIIQYYLAYEEQADDEIEVLLRSMEDPWLEEMWRNIMNSWEYNNYHMPVYQGILPDNLPQDDSLCIVIMGYGLNPDGSMKQELIDRLSAGLDSALKYPNAYVAVTGGATSRVRGVTEAGQMAVWLRNHGIGEERLILESGALSTTENAVNVHNILTEWYPQVTSIAVVTSDYHIRQSCTMFTTVSHHSMCTTGAGQLEVVGNCVNITGRKANTRFTEAWGISLITDIPFDKDAEAPALFVTG